MKKSIILISALIFYCFFVSAKGLEKIIVEKYYISDAKDAAAKKGGYLPVGSVTYRIFVDLSPDYRFQAAYGVEGHELRISTSTFFFNNSEGSIASNYIRASTLKYNTVMLDSWLSVGSASNGTTGVLKSQDTTSAFENVDRLLQNDDIEAGIAIKKRDGIEYVSRINDLIFFGIDQMANQLFGNQSIQTKGQVFSTINGSWACMGGAIGRDSTNRVLIAQLTTDGELSFELNLQIKKPGEKILNYVARNPIGDEILFPGLIFPNFQEDKSIDK